MSNDQLRQQMLELIHGLLSDEEARELKERISSDPAAARAYSEVSTEARLIAKAARLEGPKIEMPKQRGPRPAAAQGEAIGWLPWVVYLALSLLVAATLGGYLWDRAQRRDVARNHLRMVVEGPATLTPGVESRIRVWTASITGQPLPASVELSLKSLEKKQSRQLLDGNQRIRRADDSGQPVEFVIPANLTANQAVQMEVVAHDGGKSCSMQRQLAIDTPRMITHLSLDKPWYKPGETVYFRSLTLEGLSLSAQKSVPVEFEILDPAGAAVDGSLREGMTDHGVGNGAVKLKRDLPGGTYTLVARSPEHDFSEQKKTLYVQDYRVPRLNKSLDLTRDSYAPGDEVVADFAATRAEGGAAAGAKLLISAIVDGEDVIDTATTASANGTFQVRFKLPEKLEEGIGQLAVIVDDGAVRETVAKTIPINLGTLKVDFYPEGGDLVEGLANRVYFTALDPAGEPVHAEGQVVDGAGRAVADVKTVRDGRGSFTFTPAKGQTYQLKLAKPQNVKNELLLPPANPLRNAVLSTGSGVFAADEPLKLAITAARSHVPLAVTATCRGTSVGQVSHVTSGATEHISLPLAEAADGVIRVTVFDYSGPKPEPIAERLVYRRPGRKLNVAVESTEPRKSVGWSGLEPSAKRGEVPDRLGTPTRSVSEDKPGLRLDNVGLRPGGGSAPVPATHISPITQYSPGQRAELKLKVTNERGQPVPAVLGVAVVDDAVLALARQQTKHQPAAMPTQFRLGAEIEKPEQLEDVNFYLSDDPQAAESLDLLLGTQGWRRFANERLAELVKKQPDGRSAEAALEKVVDVAGPGGPPVIYDNLEEIRGPYERQLLDDDAARNARLALIGNVAFYGGVGLLVVIAALGFLQLLRSPRVWVPAMAVATACLIVGGMWTVAPLSTSTGPTAVAVFRADDVRPLVKIHELTEGFGGGAFGGGAGGGFGGAAGGGFGSDEWEAAGGPGKIAQFRANLSLVISESPGSSDALPDSPRQLPRGGEQESAPTEDEPAEVPDGEMDPNKRFTVRQYAHRRKPAQPGVRTDFAETLYWNPLLIANARGEATIRFDLSDAVTTFRVLADAQLDTPTADGTLSQGRIGAGGGTIVSRQPFSVEPKLPVEVTAGDTIDLPVAVVNDTQENAQVELSLEHDCLLNLASDLSSSGGYTGTTTVAQGALLLNNPAKRKLDLKAALRHREFFTLVASGQPGTAKVKLTGSESYLVDAVERTIAVVPPGFPVSESYAGRLDAPQSVNVKLPKEWVPGSLAVSVECYPTTLADLQAGLDSILQEPTGCFEQASASNYPNVLTVTYLKEHHIPDIALRQRSRDLMTVGYKRLAGYECKRHGFEWFGADPAHEALTAYGLMQFRDMAAVYTVDPAMLQRTTDWLLSRRDGKGGFQQSPQEHGFGGAPPRVLNAYIVWALTESGQKEIDREVDAVIENGRTSDDPYEIALAAASALNYGQLEAGGELLKKLADKQQADGHLTGTQGTITGSGGKSLDMETTALAALAWLKPREAIKQKSVFDDDWLKLPAFAEQVNKAVDWIVKNRDASGGFGSTQGTILALKALVAHARVNRATVGGGQLIVSRDDTVIGLRAFERGAKNAIRVAGFEDKLQPGDNNLTIKLTGENKLPYALRVAYRSPLPASRDESPLRLTTKLDAAKVAAGKTVALQVTLTNTSDKGQPMAVAILGIPGGTQPRADQLEELKKKGTIDYFETRPREVICYWRGLAPKRVVDLRLDLVAEIPGRYTAPASRAYLYYTAEQKQWVEPVKVEIARE